MRQLIVLLLCTLLYSCNTKPTKDSVDKFDMSEFCSDYHVLTPGNSEDNIFVFIDRKEFSQRFFIWKDKNMRESGYGYLYSYTLSIDEAIKNGVYNTASQAVATAEKNLPERMILLLNNIIPVMNNKWSSDGEILYEICINKTTKIDRPDFTKKIESDLIGVWKGDKNCEVAAGYFNIGKHNPISIEINSNQIYILANLSKVSDGKYQVYFKETEELGRGGMARPWSEYSTDKPIAEIVTNKDKIKLRWFGFYNMKSNEYEWTREADWLTSGIFDGNLYFCQ